MYNGKTLNDLCISGYYTALCNAKKRYELIISNIENLQQTLSGASGSIIDEITIELQKSKTTLEKMKNTIYNRIYAMRLLANEYDKYYEEYAKKIGVVERLNREGSYNSKLNKTTIIINNRSINNVDYDENGMIRVKYVYEKKEYLADGKLEDFDKLDLGIISGTISLTSLIKNNYFYNIDREGKLQKI